MPLSVDLGVAFTYTGCGGRDLKGTKQNPKNLRTAEQTSDQSFDWPLNAAIKVCLCPPAQLSSVMMSRAEENDSARPRRKSR